MALSLIRYRTAMVVVALYNRAPGYPTDLAYPDFLDWQRSSHSFEQFEAFADGSFDLMSG